MLNSKECLIIAGEKSGEDHAMSFVPGILENSSIQMFGVGGDQLKKLGVELLYDLKEFSSWGVSEVIGKIPFYIKAMNRLLDEVEKRNCKYAILIDFQDFNLRISKKLKKRGVEVFYYVAPQAWAWKAWRAKALEENVHTLFTIIPFEKRWFSERGVSRVKSVKHPLLEHYQDRIKKESLGLEAKPFERFKDIVKLLILPGSRKHEVTYHLPIFMDVAQALKKQFNIELSIVKSDTINPDLFSAYNDQFDRSYSSDELENGLINADICLAVSGTVTLATALFEVPSLVCYRSSLLNEFIFYTFLSYDGPISLANIVHEDMVFPEFTQDRVTSFNLKRELLELLTQKERYDEVKKKLAKTKDIISGDNFSVSEYIKGIILKDD